MIQAKSQRLTSKRNIAAGIRVSRQVEFYADQRRFPEELHQAFRLARLGSQPLILFIRDHHHSLFPLPGDALRDLGPGQAGKHLAEAGLRVLEAAKSGVLFVALFWSPD